jgi:hypothetical protein
MIKRPFLYQRLLDGLDLGDDDRQTDEVVVERGDDLLQLTLDVDRLNGNARAPKTTPKVLTD